MLRDAAVAMIKEQLAFRSTLDSSIVNYLQLAQTSLEIGPTKPWFLISEDTFTTTEADEERVSLPLDFLQEVEDATFRYRPDAWPDEDEVPLVKDEYDVLKAAFLDVEPGPPQAYALLGPYFRLLPRPDAEYSIRLIYYLKDDVLSSNIENRWLANVPLLLLGTAGQMMTGPTRDETAYKRFGDWITAGLTIVNGHTVSREMANREMAIGGRAW